MDYNEDTIRFENTSDNRAGGPRATTDRLTISDTMDMLKGQLAQVEEGLATLEDRIRLVLRPSDVKNTAADRPVDPMAGSDMMGYMKMLSGRLEHLNSRLHGITQAVDL